MSPHDTIVAIATPPGRAGLGVVRLSGPASHAIACALVGRRVPLEPRRATLARVAADSAAPDGTLDEVVCTWFPAPASYTGDDVVELSGHGNPVVLGGIVERAVAAGARLALPGEFTFRAYLNGRIDLAQAEAVADLIDAVTPTQARHACDQLDGTITREVAALSGRITEALATVEAAIDFPEDEEEVGRAPAVRGEVDALCARIDDLLAGARRGRVVREGARVVLAGPPNAGKSSLFNRLLAADRAIVSERAGTTRDLLTERCEVRGAPVTLVDTAGLAEVRHPEDRDGVDRARAAAAGADVVVLVLDGARPLGTEAAAARDDVLDGRLVLAVNKDDLGHAWPIDRPGLRVSPDVPVVRVSARTGAGIDGLLDAVASALGMDDAPRDTPMVTNRRHAGVLARVREALCRAQEAMRQGGGDELVAADLREARAILAEVTGHGLSDDVLSSIFARFCVGK
jgi:tRNA modification GTPase